MKLELRNKSGNPICALTDEQQTLASLKMADGNFCVILLVIFRFLSVFLRNARSPSYSRSLIYIDLLFGPYFRFIEYCRVVLLQCFCNNCFRYGGLCKRYVWKQWTKQFSTSGEICFA